MKENLGPEGLKYFSFIFRCFCLLLSATCWGLFPYAFTFTSHATAVGTLSIVALLFNIAVGIKNANGVISELLCPREFRWRWRR